MVAWRYEISLLMLKKKFQYSKRNFISLRSHVISSMYTTWKHCITSMCTINHPHTCLRMLACVQTWLLLSTQAIGHLLFSPNWPATLVQPRKRCVLRKTQPKSCSCLILLWNFYHLPLLCLNISGWFFVHVTRIFLKRKKNGRNLGTQGIVILNECYIKYLVCCYLESNALKTWVAVFGWQINSLATPMKSRLIVSC